jgi:hypothetical protein
MVATELGISLPLWLRDARVMSLLGQSGTVNLLAAVGKSSIYYSKPSSATLTGTAWDSALSNAYDIPGAYDSSTDTGITSSYLSSNVDFAGFGSGTKTGNLAVRWSGTTDFNDMLDGNDNYISASSSVSILYQRFTGDSWNTLANIQSGGVSGSAGEYVFQTTSGGITWDLATCKVRINWSGDTQGVMPYRARSAVTMRVSDIAIV